MQTITEIRLDLKNPTITPPVHAKQNDQLTRYIKAYLYDGGVPFEPPTGALAMFRAKKPDGTECFYDTNEKGEPAIVIEGNTVTAELAHQVLTASGRVDAEINLYTADEERLTSFTFVVQVEKSALPDAEILSSDYYNILAKQIAESMGAAKDAQEAVQEVKDLAQTVSETIQQEGEAQLKAIQQSGEEQVENAKEQADRAKEYADSIDPSQFVKSVNGELPDQQGAVLLDANAIEETATRVFATPAEREKWNRPGDIINGTLMVWQRYNAADSSTYTNPNIKYVADRFQSTGTGTIRPNPRGYGADITGSITVQYWMEPEDFALLPDPYTIYFSIDGEMLSVTKTKEGTYVSSDGNASFFQRKITNATLDWVSLYPRRPVRPYAEELALCQRYYEKIEYNAKERACVTVARENNNYFGMLYNFYVKKRKAPTVKLYQDGNGTEGSVTDILESQPVPHLKVI